MVTTFSPQLTGGSAADLAGRLRGPRGLVGVVGLGYVGLPVCLAFVAGGLRVIGFDVDSRRVERLAASSCDIPHLDQADLAAAVAHGLLTITADFTRLAQPDAVIICVPTPLDRHREPDLSHVEATASQIARTLRAGQLVVLESTTYPGTCDEVMRPALEASGLTLGIDFFLAFSPERVDPGNHRFAIAEIPKLVGGVDPTSGALAELLYRRAFRHVVRVSSARVAEASKLTENVFRAVNIALVNELKMVYDGMGIDIWEVLDAASTKPFGFMRFDPGPGWGGHCIPLDPFYLSWKARETGCPSRFVDLAGEINREMPKYVISKLVAALNERHLPVRGARILLLGLAYKRDIADPRESPAFEILHRLIELGAEVLYHDPHIPEAPSMRSWPDLPPLRSTPLSPCLLSEIDAVVVVTDHRSVDYDLIAAHAPLVIDTRGVLPRNTKNLVRA
ncbi:MAG TPA: nucleotide sugar dehydrogenase [Thermoanaerobaculia bacterium]